MKRILLGVAAALVLVYGMIPVDACTTAVISGKCTPDGRPMLFKNRDTSAMQNRILYVDDGDYAYIGVISSSDTLGTHIWSGVNEAGFAIMNAVSYNINHGDTATVKDRDNGTVMRDALAQCATLADFERMLDDMGTPLGVEANYGVIDARGGAAYYETGNSGFSKFDANDQRVAPLGYIVRTNYSFDAPIDEGQGFIRFDTAERLFYRAANMGDVTPRFVLQDVTRSLRHSLTGIDLYDMQPADAAVPEFVPFRDFIPRYLSASTFLVHGVKDGESPELATMWTVLGFPLCSVALPAWVAAGPDMPQLIGPDDEGNAPICTKALELKKRCFPISRGNGRDYLNLAAVVNEAGTGIWQGLRPVENMVRERTYETLDSWRRDGFARDDMHDLYRWIDDRVTGEYRRLFGL